MTPLALDHEGLEIMPVHVQERNARDVIHYQYKSTTLRVDFDRVLRGNFFLPHEWSIRQVTSGRESEEEVVGVDR